MARLGEGDRRVTRRRASLAAPLRDAGPAAASPVRAAAARRHSTSVLAALFFLTAVAAVGAVTVKKLDVAGEPFGWGWGLRDFRDAIYYPVRALLDGNNPYDPAAEMRTYPVGNTFPLYLPLTLVLHLPFGFLPYRAAQLAYFLATAALMPLLAYLTLRLCGVAASVASVLGLAGLIVFSRPGYWNLFLGQCTATMAIASYAALLLARRRPGLAALGVAVASLKPTFGVPLVVLMLVRRQVRSVIMGLALSGIVSLAATVVLAHNAGGVGPLLHSLVASHADFGSDPEVNPATATYRIDTAAFLGRLLGRPLGTAADVAILVAILGVAAVGVRRLDRSRDSVAGPLAASLVSLAILACTYHQTYDLLLLALPMTAVVAVPSLVGPIARRVLVAALAVPACNYLVSDTVLHRTGFGGPMWLVVASLNGAALLVALSLVAVAALRHAPAG